MPPHILQCPCSELHNSPAALARSRPGSKYLVSYASQIQVCVGACAVRVRAAILHFIQSLPWPDWGPCQSRGPVWQILGTRS